MLRSTTYAEGATPLHLAACEPSLPCPQESRCARCDDRLTDPGQRVIDASTTLTRVDFCSLFVDVRGSLLVPHETPLEAA